MTKQIEAIYEDGVLKPLEPLELEDQQRVRITIENGDPLADLIDPEYEAWCARESKDAPSIEKAREILSKVRSSLSDVIISERDQRQMVSYYLDSSALVKYYHPQEAGSAEVIRLVREANARHFISRLTTVEVVSAFAIKARTREIEEDDFEPLRQRFLRDVAQRQFQNLRLTNAHYQEAVSLFQAHFMRRFRAYDSVHLSVALDLARRGFLDFFVSADESLCSVATDEGLSTLNPLELQRVVPHTILPTILDQITMVARPSGRCARPAPRTREGIIRERDGNTVASFVFSGTIHTEIATIGMGKAPAIAGADFALGANEKPAMSPLGSN